MNYKCLGGRTEGISIVSAALRTDAIVVWCSAVENHLSNERIG